MSVRVQIIHDSNGEAAGVFIPMEVWNQLKKQLGDTSILGEYNSPRDLLLHELKESIAELKLVQEGRLRARPAQDFLDEL